MLLKPLNLSASNRKRSDIHLVTGFYSQRLTFASCSRQLMKFMLVARQSQRQCTSFCRLQETRFTLCAFANLLLWNSISWKITFHFLSCNKIQRFVVLHFVALLPCSNNPLLAFCFCELLPRCDGCFINVSRQHPPFAQHVEIREGTETERVKSYLSLLPHATTFGVSHDRRYRRKPLLPNSSEGNFHVRKTFIFQ